MSTASPTAASAASSPRLKWFRALQNRWGVAQQWVKKHRTLTAIFVAWVLLTLTSIAIWHLVAALQPEKKYVNLDAALAALEKGDNAKAVQIAGLFLPWNDLPEPRQWIPPYIFGMVNSRRADRLWGERMRQQHLLAARYLAEATSREIPEAQLPQALFECGRSHFEAGQFDRCIVPLEELVELDSRYRVRAHRLLSLAYAEGKKPNWEKAAEHNKAYLAADDLEPDDLEAGRVFQGRLQVERGDLSGAITTFDSVPDDSHHRAEALYWQSRAILRQAASLPADKRTETLERAVDRLAKCAHYDNWSGRYSPQAVLLKARALQSLGKLQPAVDVLVQLDQLYPDTPEQQAARVDRAMLLLQLKRDDESLTLLREVVELLLPANHWNNPWLSWSELQDKFRDAFNIWFDGQDYTRAAQLIDQLDRLLDPTEAARLGEDAFLAWVKIERDKLPTLAYDERQTLLEDIADRERLMAELYERLLRKQKASREYPELLWRAAEHRRAASDFTQAIDHYQTYIASFAKPRRTQAFLAAAECHLALDDATEALTVLAELTDLPDADVARLRIPLATARAYQQRGESKLAEVEVRKILDGDQLTPESVEWRDALRLYARLLYESQRYELATIRLEEVLQRYPTLEDATETQYLLAEAYRRAGEQFDPVGKSSTGNAAKGDERALQQARAEAVRRYEASLAMWITVIEALSQRELDRRITPDERTMMRNALFSRGAVCFALQNYETAITSYLAAVHRYQNTPEALDALVQISDCYRRLNRPVEARGTLLQARLVLQKLPPETEFASTTNYSRDEWMRLLDTLIAL